MINVPCDDFSKQNYTFEAVAFFNDNEFDIIKRNLFNPCAIIIKIFRK